MKTHEIGCGDPTIRRLRSFVSAQISRRVAASVGVILIAFVVVAATTAGKHTSVGHRYGGSNLMLLPGQPGLAPALY